MSKFCNNCGSILDDDAMFCTNCGAQEQQPAAAPAYEEQYNYGGDPIYGEEQPSYDEAQPEAGKSENPLKGIMSKLGDLKTLIIGAVAVIAVVVLCVLLFGSSVNKAVKNYQAVLNGKAGKVASLAPSAYWKYWKDEEGITKADVKKDFKEQYEDSKEELEELYGKNVKFTIKVTEKDKMSKKDLEEIADQLEDNYEIDDKKVKAGYELECEMTIKGKEDDDEIETTLYAVKISGNWYVVSASGTFYVDSFLDY